MRVGADRLCSRRHLTEGFGATSAIDAGQGVGDVKAGPECVNDAVDAFGELNERLKRLRAGGRSRCRPGNKSVNPAAIEGVVWVRVRSFNLPLSQRR